MSIRFLIPVAVTMLATLPGAGLSQSRPDFSGDWIRADSTTELRTVATVGDAGFRVGTMGSGWGSPLTLRQQANQLVVEYAFFGTYDLQPRLNFTFKLDGSESRQAVMIGHAESVLRSRVAWRDTTLVITTIYPTPPGTTVAEMRQSLTLASPTTLIVETTRGGIAGTTPAVIRTVYAKR